MLDKNQSITGRRSDEEIIRDAISRSRGCTFGIVVNGMNSWFQVTRVVNLYRNEECYFKGDPVRDYIEGYEA